MFTNLNELKNQASIYDVVNRYVKLKKHGAGYVGSCPFHSEKTPSFNVFTKTNRFKCFGCGKSGDVIEFVSSHDNVGFIEAVKRVAEIVGFPIETESKTIVRPIPRLEKLSKEFLDNFENVRKISNNTLLRFNITEATEWMPKAKKEIKVICFNYMRDGEVVNIKFRGKNKDMKLAKDAELIFYNIDAISDTDECVIVEGEIDCLSMYEAGVHNCVSVPNGANNNLKYIDNCYDYFVGKKKIIIAVDNDEAGRTLRNELLFRFGIDRCYLVEFPEDCKDSNDVLIKYGKEKLSEIVKAASPIPLEGLVPERERSEEIFSMHRNGMPKGTPAGIFGLDHYIRFGEGLVTIITGSPGSGKSEFLDYILAGLAVKEGWRFGVFSFENQPTKIHDAKLLEKIIGKAFAYRKDAQNRITENQIAEVLPELFDKFKLMDKTKIDLSFEGILNKAEELIMKFGIKGLVIDPYNKILHNMPSGMTETNYINTFMTRLTSFAQKWNIHIFLVAHPTKLITDKNTKKQERPTLYSIAGSANFYNQTDNGFVVYRDKETKVVDVYVEKIRFSEQGQLGFVSFYFDTMTRQYSYATSLHPITAEGKLETTKAAYTGDIELKDNEIPF